MIKIRCYEAFLSSKLSYFKRLKQVELLGSLSKGSLLRMVKNPLITLPIVSPESIKRPFC